VAGRILMKKHYGDFTITIINKNLLDIFSDYISSFEPKIHLTDLTIVIPTYERPAYLLRQIAYLSKWDTPVEIVDGSTKPLDDDIIKIINRLPHINYQHSNTSYAERISDASQRIKTPYAMCLAEDDLYLHSGLVSAIKELELNKNAVACMGQSLGFDRFNKKLYAFHYGNSLYNYSVNDSSIKVRINKGIKDYRPAASYAVFRTDAFKKVWQKREGVSCLEAVEYEHAIRTYLYGGLITTPDTYWLRSFELQPVSSVVDGNRSNDFSSWYSKDKSRQERECFRARLLKLLHEEGQLTKDESESLLNTVVELILAKSHVGLMEKSKIDSLLESSLKLTNRILLGHLGVLKKTYLWQAARTSVFYAAREKNIKSKFSRDGTWDELQKVLEFASMFDTSINK
jgi:glycosyltransferase domain-containing protein